MRSAWLLLLLGTAGCLALYQRSSSDPWPCANDADCIHGDSCQIRFDCTSASGCSPGTCACVTPASLCNGVCTDMNNDVGNCGSCGNPCSTGQICNAGVCGCFPGNTLCGSVCVDTRNDPQNCGTCGATCTAYDGCTNGQCDCLHGQVRCGGACTDVMTDAFNCGNCGYSCPRYGLYGGCSFGVCQ